MASVVVNGDTSGAVTLSAPAVAGTVTVTLPATSGTMAVLPTATGVLAESAGGTGTTTGYYGFKNRIINGAMVIDQRNAGASVSVVSGTSPYTADRFIAYNNATNTYTVQQSSTAPAGFSKSVLITNNASATSATSGMYQLFAQRIEGYNIADLNWGSANASSVTLSFWVYTSQAGTYGGVLRNDANNRFYAFSFTVTANTWTKINIPIVGDTSGTWATNNTTGIELIIALSCGSGLLVATGSWGGTVALGATGQTQFNATGSATFYITGVQLEKGSTATSFDYRPYGTELVLCQRYFYKHQNTNGGNSYPIMLQAYSTTAAFGKICDLPVTMRANPTSATTATSGTFTASAANGTAAGAFTATNIETSTTNALCTGAWTGSSGLVAGNATTVTMPNNAFFSASAEL